jgi:MFS family permease
MTALSGLAGNFAQLAAARFGVGIGEASASPAAYSLLSDSFPARRRATALAIYSSGIYIGAGLGIAVGAELALPSSPFTAGLRFEQGLTDLLAGARDRALLLELGVDLR